jgi:hypothetical protein
LEKIQKPFFGSTVWRTKLFLEDIELIIWKMKTFDLEVEITDSENKYNSLEDMIENKKKILKKFYCKEREKKCHLKYAI